MRDLSYGHLPFSLHCWCLPRYVWIETAKGWRRRWEHHTEIRGGI